MKLRAKMFINNVFKDEDLFGFSEHSKDSVYYDSSNKKVLGKMKGEFSGVKIVKFVGLKSKMYSLISSDDKEVNKAKGINKKIRHKEILMFCLIRKLLDII